MKIEYSAKSVSGLVRERNEDAYLCLPEKGLFVVADGMGGHNRGDVASKMCVEAIRDWVVGKVAPSPLDGSDDIPLCADARRVSPRKLLGESIQYANQRVFRASETTEGLRGMGTTVVALLLSGKMAFIANCGDSRAYRFRNHTLLQMTKDHSLVAEYLRLHLLTKASARHFPYRNVVTKALGLSSEASFDIRAHRICDRDLFLLCSDGLTEMVDDRKLKFLLLQNDDLEVLSNKLIEAALKAGGTDNITVVLVRCRVTD